VIGFWGIYQVLSTRSKFILTFGTTGFMLIFNLTALFLYLVPAYY
jgi:hypothetical protein